MRATVWNWRRAGFFALDRLRGGRYRRNLSDLASYFADPVAYAPIADERMRRFLDHATATTDAYAPYRGVVNLRDVPVTTKHQIAMNRAAHTSRAYDVARIPSTRTSGSYGMPMRFSLTDAKRVRTQAEIIFFNRWAGFDIGMRHLFCGVSGGEKTRSTRFLQNESWFYPTILSKERIAAYCHLLRARRIESFVLHPSIAQMLARHSLDHGYSPSDYALKGVILMGEPIPEAARSDVEAAFGCRALARYSLREIGVVGHERDAPNDYHLNLSSNVVEILARDRDEPAQAGELGRVVVTDSFSHAMPLIRYETGDLVIQSNEPGPGSGARLLTPIVGRTIEVLRDPHGNLVYPVAFNDAMLDFKDVVQFQFIQQGESEYVLRLIVRPEFQRQGAVLARCRSILGDCARICVEYVDEIPALPSGKRPYVVNEWQAQRRAT